MGNIPAFTSGRPLTRADLESMPDDGHRYELSDGVLIVSPSPRPIHQRAVARLLVALTIECPNELEVLPAPLDVVLAEDTVFIPDIVIGLRTAFTSRALVGAPVLAVEVHSPSTRLVDLELKRVRLQEAGCPNYWLVDTEIPQLRCLALRDGVYEEVAVSVGDQEILIEEPFKIRLSASSLVSNHPRN